MSRVEIFLFDTNTYTCGRSYKSGNFPKRSRHSLGSSLHGEHYKQTWRKALRSSYGAKEMAPKSELFMEGWDMLSQVVVEVRRIRP